MSESGALYTGLIRHRRFEPVRHRFSYPLFMVYVDLDAVETAFDGSWSWSTRRPALAWLRPADHYGGEGRRWSEAIRDLVARRTGERPSGAVRMLTHPRALGFRMNPVSFYYCFDVHDELEAIVAEVTSTPWDERHCYVAHRREFESRGAAQVTTVDKKLHVSPFLPMELTYRWVFVPPGERLVFHMEDLDGDRKLFDATLSLRRRPMNPGSLRRVLWTYPLMTWRIFYWIYLHAAKLRRKGAPFHSHPKHLEGEAA